MIALTGIVFSLAFVMVQFSAVAYSPRLAGSHAVRLSGTPSVSSPSGAAGLRSVSSAIPKARCVWSFHIRVGKIKLHLPLEEIRYCGATSIQVMRRMRALITDLMTVLPAERHPALEHQLERLNSTVARSFADEQDKLDASTTDRQGLGVPRKS